MKKNLKKDLLRLKLLLASSLVAFDMTALKVNAKGPVYNPTMVSDGTCSYYDQLYATLNSMPAYLRDLLTPYTIYVVGDPNYIENLYETGGATVSGITDPTYREIYVESYAGLNGVDNSNYAKVTLVHELGHVFDYSNGMVSTSGEFSGIYSSEVGSFKGTSFFNYNCYGNNGIVSGSMEYFCTAYACYLLSPNELKNSCPNTYNYIQTVEYNYCVNSGYAVAEPTPTVTEQPVTTTGEETKKENTTEQSNSTDFSSSSKPSATIDGKEKEEKKKDFNETYKVNISYEDYLEFVKERIYVNDAILEYFKEETGVDFFDGLKDVYPKRELSPLEIVGQHSNKISH